MSTDRKRSRSDEASGSDLPPEDPPLPPELASVDFSRRVAWGKYSRPHADHDRPLLALAPEDEPPAFSPGSPALCHRVNAVSHRARACTIHLRAVPGQAQQQQQEAAEPTADADDNDAPVPIRTPMFMPVGTKGCLKAVFFEEWASDPALSCPIVLANTYHLALQPGTDLLREMGGLRAFQQRARRPRRAEEIAGGGGEDGGEPRRVAYNLLTDSGGFQMVSLAKLSQVTEEGVMFENPFRAKDDKNDAVEETADGPSTGHPSDEDLLLLKPEDSIRHQNSIGANIIMALDDVVSSASADPERFRVAAHRTLRWYDRCYGAHARRDVQSLFPIVQGGLDTSLGGLREQCLAGFRRRELELGYVTPGYAIGGLAGGESKDDFWRVVDQCCRALPDDKPRYLMGVGYPLDLVVCTALGVDLYDCVYPTRTARFGVCLVRGRAPGTLRLRSRECAGDNRVIQGGCPCQPCREGVPRARLHALLKAGNPLAVELATQHNLAHMMGLVRSMRSSILDGRFADYARSFVREQYPGRRGGGEDPPTWVVEALASSGIEL